MQALLADRFEANTALNFDAIAHSHLQSDPAAESRADVSRLNDCLVELLSNFLRAFPVRGGDTHNAVQSTQEAIFCIVTMLVLLLRELRHLQLEKDLLVDVDFILEDGEDGVAFKSTDDCLLIYFRNL